jgi:hypothetical protein
MAWTSFTDARGRGWQFDPDGAAHVIRSSLYNRQLVSRSSLVRTRPRDSFGMPTLTEVNTDFHNIRQATTNEAVPYVRGLVRDAQGDGERLYQFLIRAREDGESAGAHLVEMRRRASHLSAAAIEQSVDFWENWASAARFVRDVSAGALLIGATALSGGAAAAAVAGGTGMTFTGNTQDNLESGQTLERAMGNATITTSITVVTNFLIPKGLASVGTAMTGRSALTLGENVAVGLLTAPASMTADLIKTALTADAANTPALRAAAARRFERQVGSRAGVELATMLFGAWLQTRGIPASPLLSRSGEAANSLAGASLAALGDRVVAAFTQQDQQGGGGAQASAARQLDLAFSSIEGLIRAEEFVRDAAMRPG